MAKKNKETFSEGVVKTFRKTEVIIFALVSGIVGIFVSALIGILIRGYFENIGAWGLITGFLGALITCSLYFWYYLDSK